MPDTSEMPIRGKILADASAATLQSRNASYGAPFPNLDLGGELCAAYYNAARGKYSKAHDQAIFFILNKIARIATGAPRHRDNYVDAAAYSGIAYECEEEARKEKVVFTAAEEKAFMELQMQKAGAATLCEEDEIYFAGDKIIRPILPPRLRLYVGLRFTHNGRIAKISKLFDKDKMSNNRSFEATWEDTGAVTLMTERGIDKVLAD